MRSNIDAIERALTFSELALTPIVVTLPDYDEPFVAWLGILAPYSAALAWIGHAFGTYPSPEMKKAIGHSIARGIRSSVLGEHRSRAWAKQLNLDTGYLPATVYSRLYSMFSKKIVQRLPNERLLEDFARECLAHLAPPEDSSDY